MKDRYEYNKKILEKVAKAVESYPNSRFIQLLWALGIIDHEDRFFEEPNITLQKITKEV